MIRAIDAACSRSIAVLWPRHVRRCQLGGQRWHLLQATHTCLANSEWTVSALSDKGMPVLMQMLVGAVHGRKKITYKDVAQQFRKVLGKPFLRVLCGYRRSRPCIPI
jgi:hypothetical protein